MHPASSPYRRHRFPAEIISHTVWLYFRFALSYRDVEEIMAVRGITLTYETIREWSLKFGQTFANELRRRRPRPGDKWHLDEMFIKMNGKDHYLWRAVHQEGEVLDILVQSRRDKKAAKRYCQLNGNFPCDTATECDLGPLGVLEVAAVKAHIWLS